MHDASLDLLDAPINTDPDASSTDSNITTTGDGSALMPGNTLPASGSTTPPAEDSVTVPSSGQISQYTVQAGDSLSEIAAQYGVSVNTILWANDITDPSTIKTGTKLVILPVSGIEHTVRSGETLSSIAQKYGGDAKDIAQFNGISAETALQSGSTIIIPGGELSGSASAGTSSTKSSAPAKTTTTTTKSSSGTTKTTTTSSDAINYSDETNNPYKGGSGAKLSSSYFTNPLPGAILTQGIHGWNAVDLGAKTGTKILAAHGGTVILSRDDGSWNGGYGNYVIIDNGGGIETLYAHMSKTAATVGETVSAGEVIGYVGMTGDATGPHLHFEVRGAENPFATCAEMTVCSPE